MKNNAGFIRLVDNGSPDKVMVKSTGREGIDLAPHSHNCIQLVETVAGTLRVTVGEREYFVPEGYACWIPRGMVHSLTSHNRRIALRIFYFLSESDVKVADDVFSVHYVCPWAMANFRFIAGYGPVITKDDSGLLGFASRSSTLSARRSGRLSYPCEALRPAPIPRCARPWPFSIVILPTM